MSHPEKQNWNDMYVLIDELKFTSYYMKEHEQVIHSNSNQSINEPSRENNVPDQLELHSSIFKFMQASSFNLEHVCLI